MGKKKDPFRSQLKTLASIEESITKILRDYENQIALSPRLRQPVLRSVYDPRKATTYTTEKVGRNTIFYDDNEVHGGLKEGDYMLSPSTPNIVLASDLQGLYFNSTCESTIHTSKFLGKFPPKGTRARAAYWIDEESCVIPDGLAFKVDPDDTHNFLAAIEERSITQLISKLQMFGQRMAVMDSLALGAFKA